MKSTFDKAGEAPGGATDLGGHGGASLPQRLEGQFRQARAYFALRWWKMHENTILRMFKDILNGSMVLKEVQKNFNGSQRNLRDSTYILKGCEVMLAV